MKAILIVRGLLIIPSCLVLGQSQILSSRNMEFPHTFPGKSLKLEKVRNEKTGMIKIHKGGAPLSPDELRGWEKTESDARLARIGRLSEELETKRSQMGASGTTKVVIRARYPEFTYPDKTKRPRNELVAASLAAASMRPVTDLGSIQSRYGIAGCQRTDENISVCEVTESQLEVLKQDTEVGSVEVFHEDKPASVELSTLAVSAFNPGPVPPGSGSGVRAATFEFGLSAAFVNCLGVPVTYDVSTAEPPDQRHAQACFKALVHTAPSATFFHRKSLSFDGADDVNYIINNAIQTVSMSQERGASAPYHSTNSEFLVMDDFAYRYPYPVYVNLADNWGYQFEVNWQCYNAISVGNVRHTNGTTYELANCTQTKNPPPVYGSCISGTGSTCVGDREMPYVVAPGFPSTGTDFATTCLGGVGTVGCGTSYSAPVVNGIAADVIAADARESNWPEKVRAIILLTAQNVDGGDWSATSTDGRDGTGVVSGSEAVSFAQSYTAVNVGNAAVEKGLQASSIYASDFGAGSKRFYYYVPNPKPAGKHLRAVLTWDSNPIVGGSTNALSDLDLSVQTNAGAQGSYSWDGNVEVVDVAAAAVTSGGSYYIDVSPAINRIPTSGARTNFFYYAIAWEWVKDHAP